MYIDYNEVMYTDYNEVALVVCHEPTTYVEYWL